MERAAAAAQDQYKSLLAGLQAVGRVNGWQAQQIVFVGGTCGSVHVESFNKNMKALGVLESKWVPIRQKLVRSKGGRDSRQRSGTCQVGHVRVKKEQIVHADLS